VSKFVHYGIWALAALGVYYVYKQVAADSSLPASALAAPDASTAGGIGINGTFAAFNNS
jgi:hypothetical protein